MLRRSVKNGTYFIQLSIQNETAYMQYTNIQNYENQKNEEKKQKTNKNEKANEKWRSSRAQ